VSPYRKHRSNTHLKLQDEG